MDDNELREMDVKVHRALYPGHVVMLCPEIDNHGESAWLWWENGKGGWDVPHYTTDITAWEPVYALKPEWRWFQQEEPDATRVVVHTCGEWEFFDVWVEPFEATGLAAYALGRARCVIAWAGRGEG